jgi:Ca2+-binding RTX toxin-like protein
MSQSSNFVVRYRYDADSSIPTEAALVADLSAIRGADKILMESLRDLSVGTDATISAASLTQIKMATGAELIAYMSLGGIDLNRDRAAVVASSGVSLGGLKIDPSLIGGEAFLKFWEKDAQGQYKILAPLLAWANDLRSQGYNGVLLDVVNSYQIDSVWGAIAPGNKPEAYRIATTALIEIIVALEKALDPSASGAFSVGLGHNPDLLLHNAFPGGPTTAATASAADVAHLRANIDFVVVESLGLTALRTAPTSPAGKEAVRVAKVLGLSDYTDPLIDPSVTFAGVQKFAINYYNGNGMATLGDVFIEGSAEILRMFEDQAFAARIGLVPYATPNFNPTGSSESGTNIEPFQRTHAAFNHADAKPNVLVATGNAPYVLDGLGGPDFVVGNDAGGTGRGGAGGDILRGGAGADVLSGGAGADVIDGGDGIDTLDHATEVGSGVAVNLAAGYAWDGSGAVDAVSGVENAIGTNNAWTNSTFAGFSDFMTGSSLANTLSGLGGTDYIDGAGGNDVLFGGDALDYVVGGAGNDTLFGEAGNDYLDGGDGNDDLHSGTNTAGLNTYDYMFGRDGNDRNFLGTGAQYVIAGAGADQVYVQSMPVASEVDFFLDFTPGTDQIVVAVALQGATSFIDQGSYAAIAIAAPGGSYFMLVFGGTAAQVQAGTFFV